MKVKEESEKAHFKLNIQKTEIMAFSHITSWQIDGETVVRVTDFIFLFFFFLYLFSCRIIADGDSSHEIKDTRSLEEKL